MPIFDLHSLDRVQLAALSRAAYMHQLISEPSAVQNDPPAPTSEPKLMTAREAAKALAICKKTLWSLTERGEIPVVRIGRSVRYCSRDLSGWIGRSKTIGGNSTIAV